MLFLALNTGAAEEFIRIGTRDIEWLGDPIQRSSNAHEIQQKPEGFADHIGAAEVGALLQEKIGDYDDGIECRRNTLDAFGKLNEGSHTGWMCVLYRKLYRKKWASDQIEIFSLPGTAKS